MDRKEYMKNIDPKTLEKYIGVPIKIISTGPQREETVLVESFVNEI